MIATNALLPSISAPVAEEFLFGEDAPTRTPADTPTIADLLTLVREWSTGQPNLQRVEIRVRVNDEESALSLSFGLPLAEKSVVAQSAQVRHEKLSPVQECALEAAPLPHEKPVTIKHLARLAGYTYTSYFRFAVRRLVDLGLLQRVTGGVRRTPDRKSTRLNSSH